MLRRAGQLLAIALLLLAVLLLTAGRLTWWNAWAFTGEHLVLVLASAGYLIPRNPEVIAARGQAHRGTRRFDTLLMRVYTVVYLGLFATAGLEARWGDGDGLPIPWVLAGAVLLAISMVPVTGAMAVNRNLETTVRIQTDRGHQVATDGPYRWIRHPMYLGMLVQLPATALLLGSLPALLPAATCMVIMVIRTALEDRTLLRDLPGYADFSDTTRHRLIPGVW